MRQRREEFFMITAMQKKFRESNTSVPGFYKTGSDVWERQTVSHTAGTSRIHRKGSCACGGGCPSCQAKSRDLRVSQPNDPAEIEADQIADQVMRMPAGNSNPVAQSSNSPAAIHRKRDACQKEEGEEDSIQRKTLPSSSWTVSQGPAHV